MPILKTRNGVRASLAVCLAATFLIAFPSSPHPAESKEDETIYVQRRKLGRCICHTGQGSWQFLRSPMRPPADPYRCGLLLSGGDCKVRQRPRGTSGACWGHQSKECFWKRHAYSWKINCSTCVTEEKCTSCNKLIGGPDPKVVATIKRQLKIEGHSKKNPLYIAISPHFYVVTDIHRKLKVKVDGGAPRVATGHEVAHLYAQRCELAYNDFNHWFKGQIAQPGLMGVYIMRRKTSAEKYASKYLGSANTDMLFGGGKGKIAGGYCGNGFVGSLQESGNDDSLHAYCRHMIGHILFSCWVHVKPHEKNCPKWAFIGAAHFLEKLLEPHKDLAHYCSNETTAPSGPGKKWMRRAAAMAGKRIDPIETFFARDSLGAFSHADHIRAWSLMELGLREDQDRWLAMLEFLRYGNDEGYAFKEAMDLSPDQANQRWIDRLRGKRKSFGNVKRNSRNEPEDPGKRERERVAMTEDADELAGLIRGMHAIKDVRIAKAVIERLTHPSDLVRETINLVLGRTTDDAVLHFLAESGLGHRKGLIRAGVARTLGDLRYALATDKFLAMIDDSFWLARANAARALAILKEKKAIPVLQAALSESQPKAWIAIADALATFETRNKEATLETTKRLTHKSWQIRVTACRALAAYGTDDCMDALIKRFRLERGRLEEEIYAALKAVSRDDLGRKAGTWSDWWDKQKEKYGGLDPNPPPMMKEDPRYAKPKKLRDDEPHYYGRRIYSKAVGFVFDTSGSMEKNIRIPKGASTKLGNIPVSGKRMDVAKAVLAQAIRKLHPQTKFYLVFFSSNVRPWKKTLVAAGSAGKSAASAILNVPAAGETNIHGALKAALGLHEKPTLAARLDDIPDTVYFLTDGSPTRGEITSPPELLGWFEDLNRFAKVQLHVVAFGTLGVDLPFLRSLATIGGGDFIHVPEER